MANGHQNTAQMIFVMAVLALLFTLLETNQKKSGRASAVFDAARAATGLGCGKIDDKARSIPRNWKTFLPPAAGESYVDPTFGCTVTRLTDINREQPLWNGTHASLGIYYSTLTPISAGDSLIMISSNDGSWRIVDTKGHLVVPSNKMPKMNDGHPVWDAADGNVFYYAYGNGLYKTTVRRNGISNSMLKRFTEYSGITSPDTVDLSQDGDHIALVGENRDNTMDVFVWSLSSGKKTSAYRTACTVNQWGVTNTPQPGCIHKLLLTPDNLLAIDFSEDGSGPEQGVRLWDGQHLSHLQDRTNHIDTGYDLNGITVFIDLGRDSTLSEETNPCPSHWGLDVRQIHNVHSAICLLDNQPSWHVSYRGGPSQPWAALSFFDDRKTGPEFFNGDKRFQPPSADNWKLYEDEIVLARIDGGSVYRLAHARSRSAENYASQPHAAISRDGKYVLFNSNMAYPNGCPAHMHVSDECTDVYMIKVR